MDDEPEYAGLMAAAWDPLRGDTSDWPDRSLFLSLVREAGEPVLDVGCGTGRLLLDYLAQGIDVDGVDISPDMLAILRAKADEAGLDVTGRVHVAAMEDMELPRRYRVVLVPSASFQLVLEPSAASAAMRRFAQHLVPGGTLAMAWLDIAKDHPDGADETFVQEVELEDGSVLRRTFRGSFDPSTGFEHTDDLYERLRDGVVVDSQHQVRSPATRNYTRAEIVALHEAAGLGPPRFLSRMGGASEDDDRVAISVAQPAAPPAGM
jgi:SAM-dependent methyltransferase